MRVGTALPVTIEGVTRDTILSWAREAEAAGYSSLAVPDRLAWDNLDPLLTLAAAGAVTERIGLLSNILITPLRSTHVLAKEIGTLTALAPGRVVMGLGIGARPNDYALAGLPFERRGAVMDTQLAKLTRLFAGERDADGHRIGPPPVGEVQILIGGASPNAVNRILRWGHGFIGGAVNAHITGLVAQGLRQAFAGAGRTDTPASSRTSASPRPRRRATGPTSTSTGTSRSAARRRRSRRRCTAARPASAGRWRTTRRPVPTRSSSRPAAIASTSCTG